ncbi:MAG: hypothetical protein ACJAS1_000577 [Oleiphilaceae bacterium]|jgi:hypothetical protein
MAGSSSVRKTIVEHGGSMGALDFSLHSIIDHERDAKRRLSRLKKNLAKNIAKSWDGADIILEGIERLTSTLDAIHKIKKGEKS